MPSKFDSEKMVFPSACAKRLGCRTNLVSAVKRQLCIKRKKVFPSEIKEFLISNPWFTETSPYQKPTPA